MIDEELHRLETRLAELTQRIIPDLEDRTQVLYSQILQAPKESDTRERLEHEYRLQSKELTLRSDEVIRIRQDKENLEHEKTLRR